ncbi:MAG: sensor histidine kinase [Acidimicrobiia bacterium]
MRLGLRLRLRLRTRLFLAALAVALVGGLAAYLTVRLLAPRLFERRLASMAAGGGPMAGGGRGPMGGESVHAAFVTALDRSLLIGIGASVVTAVVLSALLARQVGGRLRQIRSATSAIAGGRYDARLAAMADPDLDAVAADVNTLAAALADTEARRSRLLGDVAHELRTPLTTIDGYLEGIIDGVIEPDPETLTLLSDEVHRLHRLADDLAAVSRAEEHQLDLRMAPVDLAELARRAGQRLRPQFDDGEVALVVTVAPVAPAGSGVPAGSGALGGSAGSGVPGAPAGDAVTVPVVGDADRLTQVLINLLGNALRATPAGGRVELAVAAGSGQATVTVHDTGAGIAAEDLPHIFERFYRADQSRRSRGSGIGLTIAREIVSAHGGTITAASGGRGRGATFTFALPLAPR